MGVTAGGPDPRERVPLRANRDFQLLWGGQAVSLLGSQTSRIAYPLMVLAMTGSPAKAGIAGFAAMLDRWLRRLADRLTRLASRSPGRPRARPGRAGTAAHR